MLIRPAAVLLLMTFALVAASCGGRDSAASAESEAAVAEIERICNDAADEAMETQGDFPVGDFDPESPSPADLPAVGEYFSTGHAIWDEALVEARAVTVPSDLQTAVDDLLDAVESDLAAAKLQAAAARESDAAAFTATLDEVEALRARVEEAADTLGADCPY